MTPDLKPHLPVFNLPVNYNGMTICFFNADGESKKKPTKNIVKGKGRKRKSKENTEALEDSDDGDYEGLEVDYMSEDSRSDQSFHSSNDVVVLVLFS